VLQSIRVRSSSGFSGLRGAVALIRRSGSTSSPGLETTATPEPKLEDARGRYLLTAFCYGTNMGPAQTARHTRGAATAHELGYVNRRHITVGKLGAAATDVINAYAGLDLPRVWGTG
jgi:hypothetical protein